jgi:hypothetical protein
MHPSDPPSPASEKAGPSSTDPASRPGTSPTRPPAWIAVAAGLVAGLVAWGIGETPAVLVRPAEKGVRVMGSGPVMPSVSPEAQSAATRQTSARAFGVLGALTGLLLGLAGAWPNGPIRRAARAGGIGMAVGGLLGAVVPWLTLPPFEGLRAADPSALLPSLLLHGTCWIPIGAVGGLALALGQGGGARSLAGLTGGILGAVLATVLYEALGASLFPMAATGEPISATAASRLLARLLVPTFAAAGAALVLASQSSATGPATA